MVSGYDTDYTELYKGLAVVIGFFLFLVLLLLVFILISYLRKWYRLKKRPAVAVAATGEVVTKSSTAAVLPHTDDVMFAKKYSKVGLPVASSSQPQTPQSLKPPKTAIGAPVEIVETKKSHHPHSHHHHGHQLYQEFPPHPAYGTPPPPPPPAVMHPNSNVMITKRDSSANIEPGRTARSSLSTIALTWTNSRFLIGNQFQASRPPPNINKHIGTMSNNTSHKRIRQKEIFPKNLHAKYSE